MMAKVAVDMWGSSIVAFSGCSCTELFLSIRNLLAAKIAEELLAKLACVGTSAPGCPGHNYCWLTAEKSCRASLDWAAEGDSPDMLRTVNILERP